MSRRAFCALPGDLDKIAHEESTHIMMWHQVAALAGSFAVGLGHCWRGDGIQRHLSALPPGCTSSTPRWIASELCLVHHPSYSRVACVSVGGPLHKSDPGRGAAEGQEAGSVKAAY